MKHCSLSGEAELGCYEAISILLTEGMVDITFLYLPKMAEGDTSAKGDGMQSESWLHVIQVKALLGRKVGEVGCGGRDIPGSGLTELVFECIATLFTLYLFPTCYGWPMAYLEHTGAITRPLRLEGMGLMRLSQ